MKLPADTQKVFNPDSGAHRRDGLNYKLTDEEIVQFREQGYLVLDEFMTEAEVSTCVECKRNSLDRIRPIARLRFG